MQKYTRSSPPCVVPDTINLYPLNNYPGSIPIYSKQHVSGKKLKRIQHDTKRMMEDQLDDSMPGWRSYRELLIYYTIGKLTSETDHAISCIFITNSKRLDPYLIFGYLICEVGMKLSLNKDLSNHIWSFILSTHFKLIMQTPLL